MNSNPNQVRRVLLAGASIAVWMLATALILFTHLPLGWAVGLGGALILVATWRYCIIAYRTYLMPWERPKSPPQFDVVRIVANIARYETQIERDSALLFADSLFNPARFFTRVAETVRTSSRTMTIDSVFQLSLPGANGNNLAIFPIIQVSRTLSADSISVSDASGAALPTLNYDQRLAIMGACLRKFVQQCSSSIYQNYVETLEQSFVHILAAEQPNPALSLRKLQAHLTGLAEHQNGQAKRNVRILTAAAWLMELMVTQRPVIVLLPLAGKPGLEPDRVVHLQRRLIAEHREARDSTRIDRTRDRIRLLMGVRPTLLSVPLSNAALTKAYHLEVIGPPGTYLARQAVLNVPSSETEPLALKTRARLGQRYGHIRIVGENQRLTTSGSYIAHFYERVPGSIASATLSALAATTIIWIAAFSQLGVSNGSNSDLVAVLLAVPALMGAWSGFDRGSSLFGGTLVARVCSILTIVVSLLAATYFILGPKDAATATAAIMTLPGARVWMCLGSAATLILLSAILSWSIRSVVQTKFVEEGVE